MNKDGDYIVAKWQNMKLLQRHYIFIIDLTWLCFIKCFDSTPVYWKDLTGAKHLLASDIYIYIN